MEEICIRGIVRTQNQELNSKAIVSRVCSLKFVLDVVGGGKGSLDVYSFYSLFSCRPLLSSELFPASEFVCLHLSVIA